MGIRKKTNNIMDSIIRLSKEKKALDIMNSILKTFMVLLILVFILYPFVSVFGKALYSNGQVNFSEFSFLKGEFYLVKNSILSATITALLSTIFALALGDRKSVV